MIASNNAQNKKTSDSVLITIMYNGLTYDIHFIRSIVIT